MVMPGITITMHMSSGKLYEGTAAEPAHIHMKTAERMEYGRTRRRSAITAVVAFSSSSVQINVDSCTLKFRIPSFVHAFAESAAVIPASL